jgi:BASS family bile acid:Na+ symporter
MVGAAEKCCGKITHNIVLYRTRRITKMSILTNIILPLALAFIMFSLGLGLTTKDFSRVILQPKDFIAGLLSQVIILPIVGFILASSFTVSPEIALGIMIIAAAPGGVTSNILTSFGRGDVALSISLTAFVSLLSVITIPLIVGFSYAHFFGKSVNSEISILRIAIGVFSIVTMPVIIGLFVKHFFPIFAVKFSELSKKISTIIFIIVLISAIFQERNNILEYYADAGFITFILNITMILISWVLASVIGSKIKQKIAITIECGLQNGTVAIAVSSLLFNGGAIVIPAATYSLTMFFNALIFIYILRRKYKYLVE